jgi:peptide-methionine (S)-S-oxide reductase
MSIVARILGGAALWAAAVAAPSEARPSAMTPPSSPDTAVFAGGCFWGVEGVFEHVKGVLSATAGYAGGSVPSPTYEQVSTGTTGHAESVRVIYDPARVTYRQLLEVFFRVAHDPTELNRQGPDRGTQYRSIAFYRDSVQERLARAYVGELSRRQVYPAPIVTEIVPLRHFYVAEPYHQHYMQKHPHAPYIVINDVPKVKHLRQAFPDLYRKPPPMEG